MAGRWLAQAAAEARATVAELLHLGRNPVINAAVIATAPLVLLMHATMPALTNSARFASSILICYVVLGFEKSREEGMQDASVSQTSYHS